MTYKNKIAAKKAKIMVKGFHSHCETVPELFFSFLRKKKVPKPGIEPGTFRSSV